MSKAEKPHDISRLCEALGLDPSSYVSFEKQSQRGSGAVSHGQETKREEREPASISRQHARPEARVGLSAAVAAASTASPAGLRPLQIAMLSLSSGTGKTTLAATLANLLRRREHSVMVADHSVYNTVQTLFGLHGASLTAVSFAVANRVNAPLPVLSKYQMGERIGDFEAWYESLAPRTAFTFVDGIVDAVNDGRRLMERGARVMIPVAPELVGAMSAVTLDKALSTVWPGRVMYVLNKFDANDAMHRDVRVWLRDSLGARLLPFEIPNDGDIKKIAAGTLQIKELAQYSPLRFALEALVELLEKCGHTEETMRAEVRS